MGCAFWLQVLLPPSEIAPGRGGAPPCTPPWRMEPMAMMGMALHHREGLHHHMLVAAMLAHLSTLAVMTADM